MSLSRARRRECEAPTSSFVMAACLFSVVVAFLVVESERFGRVLPASASPGLGAARLRLLGSLRQKFLRGAVAVVVVVVVVVVAVVVVVVAVVVVADIVFAASATLPASTAAYHYPLSCLHPANGYSVSDCVSDGGVHEPAYAGCVCH